MKKIVGKVLSVAMAASLLCGCSSQSASKETKKIGVIQLVDHTSLNTIKDAFDAELKELGYTDDNLVVDFQNGQGDMNTLASIANQFEGEDLDAVMAITTPAAQAVAKLAKNTPVIFAAVEDPVGAELTSSLEAPDKNITGTSDVVDVNGILSMALKVTPNIKKLGLLYNKGEANSVTNVAKAKAFAAEHGLEIVESTITSVNEAQTAADVLCTKVDAIFSPTDNTVASAMATVGARCAKAGTPMYVGADSMVQDGGFLSVGINYEELGKETARMVDQVLKGKNVSDMPVKIFNEDLNIYVNQKVLKQLNITLPEEITSSDKYIEM